MKRICLLLTLCCFACSKAELADQDPNRTTLTRAVPTPSLDWENCDWMPTPVGQSAIPSPWSGAGSIAAEFGMEVTNDRYRKDGWELMYNTFTSEAPGPLINPYFMLYNKYRGLLRVYLYVTTQFITTSHNLQDGLAVVAPQSVSLLRFMNEVIIEPSKNTDPYFSQIHPTPANGPSPVAANKWYMFQYELAYDPILEHIPYDQLQLSWYLNYFLVQQLEMNGEICGIISGTIGGGGSDIVSELISTGQSIGTGVLAGIGLNFLDNNKQGDNGKNNLGLSKPVFDKVYSGISSALSGSMEELPGKAINLLSAIFGFNQSPTLVDLRLEADINLTGTISSRGSFPSMPISFWMPGTNIASTASGYVPLYDQPLGVVGFIQSETEPIVKTTADIYPVIERDPYDGSERSCTTIYLDIDLPDYSDWLLINPAIKESADVFVTQKLMFDDVEVKKHQLHRYFLGEFWDRPMWGTISWPEYNAMPDMCIRFIIEVKPKNGDSPSTIVKTMRLKEIRTNIEHDLIYLE